MDGGILFRLRSLLAKGGQASGVASRRIDETDPLSDRTASSASLAATQAVESSTSRAHRSAQMPSETNQPTCVEGSWRMEARLRSITLVGVGMEQAPGVGHDEDINIGKTLLPIRMRDALIRDQVITWIYFEAGSAAPALSCLVEPPPRFALSVAGAKTMETLESPCPALETGALRKAVTHSVAMCAATRSRSGSSRASMNTRYRQPGLMHLRLEDKTA